MAVMQAHVREAMEAGALGLSTGLEFEPGRRATTEEVVRLAQVVGEYDRLLCQPHPQPGQAHPSGDRRIYRDRRAAAGLLPRGRARAGERPGGDRRRRAHRRAARSKPAGLERNLYATQRTRPDRLRPPGAGPRADQLHGQPRHRRAAQGALWPGRRRRRGPAPGAGRRLSHRLRALHRPQAARRRARSQRRHVGHPPPLDRARVGRLLGLLRLSPARRHAGRDRGLAHALAGRL